MREGPSGLAPRKENEQCRDLAALVSQNERAQSGGWAVQSPKVANDHLDPKCGKCHKTWAISLFV